MYSRSILSSILAVILVATVYDLYALNRRRVNFASEPTNILIMPVNEDTISFSETQNLIVQNAFNSKDFFFVFHFSTFTKYSIFSKPWIFQMRRAFLDF
jgi:hypothetical protein